MRLGITGYGIVQAGQEVTDKAAAAFKKSGLKLSNYTK